MAEINNKPALRFAGFTEAWEQRKAKELCNIGTGKSNTQDQVEDGIYPFYIRSDIPVKSNKYLYDCEAVITIGDGNIGRVFHYVNGKFDLHQRCYKMTDFQDIWGKYFYYFFSTRFYERAMKMTAKATVDSVRLEMISEMDIWKPTAIDEQKKIAEFFTDLDRLITLHQRKYDNLKNVKKACLEKMFPKNGSNVPEIRFKGFTEAWEQRKLSEIADIIGGGTPSTSNPEYWDGDIDWYAPAEMEGQRYAVGSVKKITELGLQKSSAQILPAGRTVLFTSRAGIGKMAILQCSAATNQGFQSIVIKDNTNPYFIYSMGSEIKKKAEGIASGSTFLEISGKMLGNLEIAMPSSQEQDKIACYFEKMDDLITLHQRKLEKLKNLKKACLEKMFV